MSVLKNSARTLSGLTIMKADILDLPSSESAIRVNNDKGSAGDVLQKSSGNKLAWGKVDAIEIPDGSITGDKLATNINILTSGSVKANDMRTDTLQCPKTGTVLIQLSGASGETTSTTFDATSKYTQTGTATNTFNGAITCGDITSGKITSGEIDAQSNQIGTTGLIITSGNVNGGNLFSLGYIATSMEGSDPPPTDNTYDDWALELEKSKGHGYIGGNLVVDGTKIG